MPRATAGGGDGQKYPSACPAAPCYGEAAWRSGHGQGLVGCEGACPPRLGIPAEVVWLCPGSLSPVGTMARAGCRDGVVHWRGRQEGCHSWPGQLRTSSPRCQHNRARLWVRVSTKEDKVRRCWLAGPGKGWTPQACGTWHYLHNRHNHLFRVAWVRYTRSRTWVFSPRAWAQLHEGFQTNGAEGAGCLLDRAS